MERRHFNRVIFSTQTTLTVGRHHWSSEIIDLSLKGALLSLPENYPGTVGETATLSFKLQGLDRTITMSGEVRHADDKHLGFECHSFDIDSATDLRRLIELNLGDERLLQRDLAALLSAK